MILREVGNEESSLKHISKGLVCLNQQDNQWTSLFGCLKKRLPVVVMGPRFGSCPFPLVYSGSREVQ